MAFLALFQYTYCVILTMFTKKKKREAVRINLLHKILSFIKLISLIFFKLNCVELLLSFSGFFVASSEKEREKVVLSSLENKLNSNLTVCRMKLASVLVASCFSPNLSHLCSQDCTSSCYLHSFFSCFVSIFLFQKTTNKTVRLISFQKTKLNKNPKPNPPK